MRSFQDVFMEPEIAEALEPDKVARVASEAQGSAAVVLAVGC